MKHTPEVEERRIAAVKAALKGKPATEAQREKRAAGLRRAHAEGRITYKPNPEARKRAADKIRGVKRPDWVVAKVRAANIGKTRSQIQKSRASEISKTLMPDGAWTGKTEEEKHEMRRKISEALKGRVVTEEQRRAHSEKMTGRACDPEHVERRAAKMRGVEKVADSIKKGPTNIHSISGQLRDPCGRLWWFTNLTHFVRENPELFDECDWEERSYLKKKPNAKRSRASHGLLQLFGNGKETRGSWKGWTAVSLTERVTGLADPMDRDSALANTSFGRSDDNEKL